MPDMASSFCQISADLVATQSKFHGKAMTLALSQRGLGMEQMRAAGAMLALGWRLRRAWMPEQWRLPGLLVSLISESVNSRIDFHISRKPHLTYDFDIT